MKCENMEMEREIEIENLSRKGTPSYNCRNQHCKIKITKA